MGANWDRVAASDGWKAPMQTFAGSAAHFQFLKAASSDAVRPVVSIGNFDGVHKGHQDLLETLVRRAKENGAPSCVYTFEPPPRVVLAPKQHQSRIMAWTDKVRLIQEMGVDRLVVERFSRAFAQHPPSWFAEEVLGRRLGSIGFVVGYDLRFGRARAGTGDLLREVLPGVSVEQVPALKIGDDIVSSTRVRETVASGDVEEATRLLGRPHFVRGAVIPGDRRGREMGFPTANLLLETELVPANGVYAVQVVVDSGARQPAVANLGVRPTVDGKTFVVEIHLLDFSGDLYGRQITVQFISRIRAEMKFDGIDALGRQIHKDIEVARAVLDKR